MRGRDTGSGRAPLRLVPQACAAAGSQRMTTVTATAMATYDPRWHRIIGEALRIRVRGPARYRNPWRRRADLVGFVDEALRH
ncbi:hypothetical protein DMB66_23010 [Actinoplanes sp. ATCC 53533]|nr:hypothetical protein DMB66_23010 [Actinoplanes sp. ATCC 53533]